MSRFAAAAWQTLVSLDAAEAGRADFERRVEQGTREAVAEEEKYRALFNSIDEGFCIIDVLFDGPTPTDYRFVEVNAAFEGQTGLHAAAGWRVREFDPGHQAHWLEVYGRVSERHSDEVCHLSSARLVRRSPEGIS